MTVQKKEFLAALKRNIIRKQPVVDAEKVEAYMRGLKIVDIMAGSALDHMLMREWLREYTGYTPEAIIK